MAEAIDELELARQLVAAASPSGREGPATSLLVETFGLLGFDEAYLDDAGNAIGAFRRGPGPVVMLNGHVDTVPTGDPENWPYPPLSGQVAEGRLWGRGSCDMKGALACMAVAAADAAADGFHGTLLVTGVVQEEVGGLGARHLTNNVQADVIILGEPSDLELKLGHRGRLEPVVKLPGRIAHAAKASLGDNALYRAASYLQSMARLQLPEGGQLGRSTATPTRISSFPDSPNVVPGAAEITIDYRNVVADSVEMVLARLRQLDPEAEVVLGEEEAVSENGSVRERFPRVNPAYLTPHEAVEVDVAREVLQRALQRHGREYREGTWWFATDAPYLGARGAPVIGFGPGEPERAHTTEEGIPVEHLRIARDAYRQLALAFLGRS